MTRIKIISTAKYLPKKIVTSDQLEKDMHISPGWIMKKTGVQKRHFVEDETIPEMGAIVSQEALKRANLEFKDVDVLVSASSCPAQFIPCNASLIQKELGEINSGIPCFDINATCLSFMVALDLISSQIELGKYKRALIVSSEIASIGLNFDHKESCALMGDGASAIIIEKTSKKDESHIITSNMMTYSAGAHFAEIKAGGTNIYPKTNQNIDMNDFAFKMDGHKIYKMASKYIELFFNNLLKEANLKIKDIDLVIPHQASLLALNLIRKKLNIPEEKFYIYLKDHGNIIAASLPIGIHNAIKEEKIVYGNNVMLLGTSAGLSIGGMILKY